MSRDYRNYTVEDFVIDRSFKNWVLYPDKASNLFWENWIENNQERVEALREARKILLSMSRIDYQPTERDEEEVWNNIIKTLGKEVEKSRVIPMGPDSILSRYPTRKKQTLGPFFYKLAASVVLFATSVGFYHFLETPEASRPEIITKANPRGQKSTVFLPDGSKVYLNSESELWYTSDYNGTERTVHLRGEAFFEVEKDTLRPFTVATKHLNTTALGTSFNVSAYPGQTPEVSLLHGKVKVVSNDPSAQEVLLAPGELVLYARPNDMKIKRFDPETKGLWRHQIIYFQDTPLDEALNTLERWYNVTFEVKGPKPYLECTGKFENDYLSNVLNSLSYSLDFTYKIEGKNVLLKFN